MKIFHIWFLRRKGKESLLYSPEKKDEQSELVSTSFVPLKLGQKKSKKGFFLKNFLLLSLYANRNIFLFFILVYLILFYHSNKNGSMNLLQSSVKENFLRSRSLTPWIFHFHQLECLLNWGENKRKRIKGGRKESVCLESLHLNNIKHSFWRCLPVAVPFPWDKRKK